MPTELMKRDSSAMELIREALTGEGTPQEKALVIKELVALQQSMERFSWEREERQDRKDFDDKLNQCQAQIGRIAPNRDRENNIKWADYAQIDRTVRPIYVSAGFSIAFSEEPNPEPGKLRMKAVLSRGGIAKEYFASALIAPSNPKMSAQDAYASAQSRAQRYLMLDIWNISIGIDKDEKAPYQTKPEDLLDESVVTDFVDAIKASSSVDELKKNYQAAMKAGASDPSALKAFEQAKVSTWKAKGFKA